MSRDELPPGDYKEVRKNLDDFSIVDLTKHTTIRKEDLTKSVPVTFDLYFEEDKSKGVTGLLDGFIETEHQPYEWDMFDVNMDENNQNPIYFVNPAVMTKEQFLEKYPVHPSRVFLVTEQNRTKFYDDLVDGWKQQMRCFSGKVTGTVTITPTGKPKIPREKKQK